MKLELQGEIVEDIDRITRIIHDYFKKAFGSRNELRWLGDMSTHHSLRRELIDKMVDISKPFTEEEIMLVVWELGADKSLGPDGFTIFFYRHFWNIVTP